MFNFGNSTASNANTSTPGSASVSGGLFGGGSTFGAAGSSAIKPFGAASTSTPFSFGQSQPQQQLQQSQQQQQQQQQLQPQQQFSHLPLTLTQNSADIPAMLLKFKLSLDPTSPSCRFQTYFYNNSALPQSPQSQQIRPAKATDPTLWSESIRRNPDPNSLIPCWAVGWNDVHLRVSVQERTAQAHAFRMNEMDEKLASLKNTTSLSTQPRLQRARIKDAQLKARMISIVGKLGALLPATHSSSSSLAEGKTEQLSALIDSIDNQLNGRGSQINAHQFQPISQGSSQRDGKLQARLAAVSAEVGRRQSAMNGNAKQQPRESIVLSDSDVQKFVDVLKQHEHAISTLVKTLNSAATQLDTARAEFGLSMVQSADQGLRWD